MNSTQASGAEIERTTIAPVTRRPIPFLLLLYIIAWLDRLNVGLAAQMNQDLGFSASVYGLGAGIFFTGYARGTRGLIARCDSGAR